MRSAASQIDIGHDRKEKCSIDLSFVTILHGSFVSFLAFFAACSNHMKPAYVGRTLHNRKTVYTYSDSRV